MKLDPYKGAVVFGPSTKEVGELYQIREVLEVLAVESAMPNLTGGDLRALQRTIDKMKTTNDGGRWLELNDEFHRRLYSRSDNPRLSALIGSLRDASSAYLHMFVSNTDRRRADSEHQQILDACKEGDNAKAREVLTTQLRHTLEVVERFLEGN